MHTVEKYEGVMEYPKLKSKGTFHQGVTQSQPMLSGLCYAGKAYQRT